MAFNQTRRLQSVKKEILKFPAGLDAIKSVVVKASGLPELPSATVRRTGVYGLLAGTILQAIPGDQYGRYRKYAGVGTPDGVLGEHIFLYQASDSPAQDAQVDMYFHGAVFDRDLIVEYSTYGGQLASALPTCRFE